MTAGKMRDFGGSKADPFNKVLLNDTLNTLRTTYSSEEWKEGQHRAVAGALIGIAPKDELEGMLAAQMIAAHQASMECFRRAMLPEQSFEGRKENLSQANKLSRTYTTLLEALNRHRGKGQQKVTVEHVHVHAGGQAIVGAVETPGGVACENEGQPHAEAFSHAPVAPLWSERPEREAVSIASDAEREMPDAWRRVPWSAEG